VPAAAVIPAPIAYIKAVAVKKLVVGSENFGRPVCLAGGRRSRPSLSPGRILVPFTGCRGLTESLTLKKSKCPKQAGSA
jgi:hypothetical protein